MGCREGTGEQNERAEREGRDLETTQRGNSKGDTVALRCASRRTYKMPAAALRSQKQSPWGFLAR